MTTLAPCASCAHRNMAYCTVASWSYTLLNLMICAASSSMPMTSAVLQKMKHSPNFNAHRWLTWLGWPNSVNHTQQIVSATQFTVLLCSRSRYIPQDLQHNNTTRLISGCLAATYPGFMATCTSKHHSFGYIRRGAATDKLPHTTSAIIQEGLCILHIVANMCPRLSVVFSVTGHRFTMLYRRQ